MDRLTDVHGSVHGIEPDRSQALANLAGHRALNEQDGGKDGR